MEPEPVEPEPVEPEPVEPEPVEPESAEPEPAEPEPVEPELADAGSGNPLHPITAIPANVPGTIVPPGFRILLHRPGVRLTSRWIHALPSGPCLVGQDCHFAQPFMDERLPAFSASPPSGARPGRPPDGRCPHESGPAPAHDPGLGPGPRPRPSGRQRIGQCTIDLRTLSGSGTVSEGFRPSPGSGLRYAHRARSPACGALDPPAIRSPSGRTETPTETRFEKTIRGKRSCRRDKHF